jgi:hypothetical protein
MNVDECVARLLEKIVIEWDGEAMRYVAHIRNDVSGWYFYYRTEQEAKSDYPELIRDWVEANFEDGDKEFVIKLAKS